jgi:hypothetical protein
MATIVNNSKYGEGHQIVLKEQSKMPSTTVAAKFKQNNYSFGSSTFSIVKTKLPKNTKVVEIDLGGKDIVYLKDQAGKIVELKGTASLINGSFNHFTANAKSNTTLLTEIKETISMNMFQQSVENNKIMTEDEVIASLDNNMVDHFDTIYYESGLEQTKQLKRFIGPNKGYTYERQGKDKTKKLYDVARKLTGKLNDNWNPADVWMIKKNYDMNILYNSKNFKQLNSEIAKALEAKMLIPISLKQVSKREADLSIVDPAKISNSKLDLDLSPEKIDLSESFNNFIVWTKSGFGVRAGFKASATTLNVSLEGRFKNAGYQVGAVDAKDFAVFVASEHESLETGSASKSDIDTSKKKLKLMLNDKEIKVSTKLESYDAACVMVDKGDTLLKNRFFNLMSYMFAFYTIDFEEIMKFCYYSSKKISDTSSPYVIIQ